MKEAIEKRTYSTSEYLRFIVPSVIGLILFMLPFKYQGDTTIAVALFAKKLTSWLEGSLPTIVLGFVTLTGILTGVNKIAKPAFIQENKLLKDMFDVGSFWTIARIIGMVFCYLIYFEIGPEMIWSGDTGGLILHDLMLTLFTMFLFAGFLLPFLTDFGLLEYVGVLLTPVMRPLFTLPGRSSIDCIASWVGDGTIGVALTNKQYEEGYYTAREAAVISTTFSAVSITFCLVILDQVGLSRLFGPYYLTVMFAGVVAAIIVPKLPPLSKKKDSYYGGVKQDAGENVPEGYTNQEWGMALALEKAKESGDVKQFIKNGASTVLEMWIGVLPAILFFGTIALVIAEYTPLFQWLGIPFIPILKLLQIPYAVEASQTMIVGFADMFLPAIIGSSIPSEMTRFVIASVSVTQLVYLSEVGAVILGSKIPVTAKDLFLIFIQRTLITLPIVAAVAHIIF